MKTTCPPSSHQNVFVATHSVWHMMYIYTLLVTMNQSELNKLNMLVYSCNHIVKSKWCPRVALQPWFCWILSIKGDYKVCCVHVWIYLFVYLYAYLSVCVSLYINICVYYVSGFLNRYIVLWWETSGKGLII